MTDERTMTEEDIAKVIASYDEDVRANDAAAEVAADKQGEVAFEVLDTAHDLGYTDRTNADDAALRRAARDYRERLAVEQEDEGPLDFLDRMTQQRPSAEHGEIVVGRQFVYREEDSWTVDGESGVHVCEVLAAITNVDETGFDWERVAVLADLNPPPRDPRQPSRRGGVALFSIDRAVASGAITWVDATHV